MRYSWPEGHRCAVVLSFDFDAESAYLYRDPEGRSLARLEERRYGPRVGVYRILRLLEEQAVPGTFFIPGWTAANHPEPCRAIRDAGHEIGAHGNLHETVDSLSPDEEQQTLVQSLDILNQVLGVRPVGYRSPSWELNPSSPALLAEHGFLYDSSLMGNDIPYDLAIPGGTLVEVPVQWMLDDMPLFRHVAGSTNAIADPDRVLRMWSQEFSALHAENGCFVLTCHPWVIGRPSRMALLAELIAHIRSFEGVWFATAEQVARWHRHQTTTSLL